MNYSKMTKKELIEALMLKENPVKLSGTGPTFDYLQEFWSDEQENFVVLLLDSALNLKKKVLVTKGTINRTLVHPREVFAPAIENRSVAIITAHNHPTGDLTPSQEDYAVADTLNKASKILGITYADNIIFSNKGYYSFREKGELI